MQDRGAAAARDTHAMGTARGGRAFAALALALAVYVALALWFLRPLWRDPFATLAVPAEPAGRAEQPIGLLDLAMVVSVVARNARVLASRPWELLGGSLCFPVAAPYTLGEHMFGLGILAAPAMRATGDPLFSFNAAIFLTLVIPAVAMFLLARAFTESVLAALVSGILFGFLPVRIEDTIHPYGHGDLWLPLVLLFWYRLLKENRWRDALALVAALLLQLLESFYAVLELSVVAGVFGAWAVWRYRHRLPAVWPKIAFVGSATIAIAAAIFLPYLETRSIWGLPSRSGFLNVPGVVMFGGIYYPGSVACVLALVAIADRVLRGARGDDDPRLAILAAGVAAWWFSLAPIPVPSLGWTVPAPLQLVGQWVPGIDAVRVPGTVALGASLACALLAGFGVVTLTRGRGAPSRIALGLGLALLAAIERAYPPLVHASFARTTELTALRFRPDAQTVDLARRAILGPTVDLPVPTRQLGVLQSMADQILLAAYHDQPTSACYNSFQVATTQQVQEIAGRLPDRAAAAELAALGFRRVTVFKRYVRSPQKERLAAIRSDGAPLRPAGESKEIAVFELGNPGEPSEDWALLTERPSPAGSAASEELSSEPASGPSAEPATAPCSRQGQAIEVAAATARSTFCIANRGGRVFRHPRPIEPSDLEIVWRPLANNAAPVKTIARALLPVALAPGDAMAVAVETPAPALSGEVEACLDRAASPGVHLACKRATLGETVASSPGAQR